MGTIWCCVVSMRGPVLACLILFAGLVHCQESTESSTDATTTTTSSSTSTTEAPVVIVKQVNEINEDGSYTVGYEASDGSFRLETKDAEGNVEGKYGFLDENGEIKIVEYSANNSTGFQSDLELEQVNALTEAEAAPQQADPAFELEKKRHEAVIAFQKAVVEKQQQIAQKNDASAQRQNFANTRQGARRPVFNAANFNPSRPASEQFNTGNFNEDFRDFQQQQRPNQFQAQFQQNQQFAQNPQQFQQNQQFAQNPQQFQQPRQFAPQPQQPNPAFQFQQRPQVQQQQQFAPQQQFAQQPQQFAPQRPQQPAQVPVSQLTREQIALEGFSRDDDQDGQIDPLPAHLLPQQQQPQFAPQQPQQPQQFAPQQPQQQFFQQQQQQQFFQQPQQQQNFAQNPQFFQQQQQPFRTPQPVGPSPAQAQPQFSQQQLQQFLAQSQSQQRFQ